MNGGKAIAPTDLRDFLKSQGWAVLEQALKDRLYVLENERFARRQLVFPMDLTAPDYAESVFAVVQKMAELTGQSSNTLISRIYSLRDDVLRIRVFFDGNDGALPLSFASTLVNSAEKLLKSAACTVLLPRINHPRLTLIEATQFVDAARFGQTENGSFVLRIACPINAMEVHGSSELGASDAPFVRQVTLVLQRALSQLSTAIEADALDRLVDELKRSPVPLISANLCEAISAMHDERVDNSLDVGFDWSVLRRVASSLASRTVRIQRDYFSRIEEVRRELRAVELYHEETFIGTVERLDGEMGADGRRSGAVVLSLLLAEEGETVRARTVLSADDYAEADRAHMTNGAYVRVTGRLRQGRQPRQLADPSRFEVLLRAP
ncbi:hypothetical protein [Pararobbsia alpina]|uniref:Uncharacterized protein n=1 Tax=Pararobbsia alpina TaxID=621374 RepID=A0A6S7ASQ4_9BURK|nr:hypothetical protein [Pararobbsia alpina]CAB3775838.1 hypothetical protein LMG28138_00026 [Pararobbsia alpina]